MPHQSGGGPVRWKPLAWLSIAVVAIFAIVSGCQQSSSRFASGTGGNYDTTPAWQAPTFEPQPVRPIQVETPTPITRGPGMPQRLPAEWNPAGRHNNWRWIVIHHSATSVGGAVRFDDWHRNRNGWDELGYHFVIGNGSDTRNGQVETGSRWLKQKHGAHARTHNNEYNRFGIGICLVGNFDYERPTQEQLHALAVLTAYLMQKYDIPESRVIAHRDVGTTACPGRHLPIEPVRRLAARALANGFVADAGAVEESRQLLAGVARAQ